MIRENLKGECKGTSRELGFTVMIPAVIATSIDAFAVGITLTALNVKILPSAALIGTTTFLIAFVGVWIGHFFRKSVRKPGRNIRRCNFSFNQGTDFYYGLTKKIGGIGTNEKIK